MLLDSSTYPHGAMPMQLIDSSGLLFSHFNSCPSFTASPTHLAAPQLDPLVIIHVHVVWEAYVFMAMS